MLNLARRFIRDDRGLAALEFALIGPVMALLLLGTFELCDALSTYDRVEELAYTGADLVAQETSITSTDTSNIFAAMNEILYPSSSTNVKYVISSILSDGNGAGKVAWSKATTNATAMTPNTIVTVPTGLMLKAQCAASACSLIKVQVTYPYTSPVGNVFLSTINMTQTFYTRPRRSVYVTCSSC